jgi:hypothetical protein
LKLLNENDQAHAEINQLQIETNIVAWKMMHVITMQRFKQLKFQREFNNKVYNSRGPVYEFVCISFRTDNLNCFEAS